MAIINYNPTSNYLNRHIEKVELYNQIKYFEINELTGQRITLSESTINWLIQNNKIDEFELIEL